LDPVAGRIVAPGRGIHSRNVGGRKSSLLKMGVRTEQRAFAKLDLNSVIDRYLPEKLKQPGKSRP
jgi:DNA topoisomerase VI subunit A